MRGLSCGERAILQQDGDEEPIGDQILSRRDLTARVAHDCEDCPKQGLISPGERYTQLVGLDADMGGFFIRRYCKGGHGCFPVPKPMPARGDLVPGQPMEDADGYLPF